MKARAEWLDEPQKVEEPLGLGTELLGRPIRPGQEQVATHEQVDRDAATRVVTEFARRVCGQGKILTPNLLATCSEESRQRWELLSHLGNDSHNLAGVKNVIPSPCCVLTYTSKHSCQAAEVDTTCMSQASWNPFPGNPVARCVAFVAVGFAVDETRGQGNEPAGTPEPNPKPAKPAQELA